MLNNIIMHYCILPVIHDIVVYCNSVYNVCDSVMIGGKNTIFLKAHALMTHPIEAMKAVRDITNFSKCKCM